MFNNTYILQVSIVQLNIIEFTIYKWVLVSNVVLVHVPVKRMLKTRSTPL